MSPEKSDVRGMMAKSAMAVKGVLSKESWSLGMSIMSRSEHSLKSMVEGSETENRENAVIPTPDSRLGSERKSTHV